jgi:hypothetical protein
MPHRISRHEFRNKRKVALIPDFTKPTARDLFRWIHNLVANDERMHHYQRGRASITGLVVELRKIT